MMPKSVFFCTIEFEESRDQKEKYTKFGENMQNKRGLMCYVLERVVVIVVDANDLSRAPVKGHGNQNVCRLI